MRIVVLDKQEITVTDLPAKVQGQINLVRNYNGKSEFIANVTAQNGEWTIVANETMSLFDQNNQEIEAALLSENTIWGVQLNATKEKVILYVEPETVSKGRFAKLAIAKNHKVTVGNFVGADIFYETGLPDCPIYVELEYIPQQNRIIVRNKANTRVYLNRRNCLEAEAVYGDQLYILGLTMIFGKEFIEINRPNINIRTLLEPWKGREYVGGEPENANMEDMIFSCSPRENDVFQPPTLVVERPPALSEPEKQPMILMVGPAITMAGASVLTSVISVQSIMASNGNMMNALPSMVMAGSMVMGSLIWPMFSRKSDEIRTKRKNLASYQLYKKHIEGMDRRIDKELADEAVYLKRAYPTLDACIDKISGRETSLWERSLEEKDFLDMYVGIGDRRMMADVVFPAISELESSDSCKEELQKLQSKEMILKNVPNTVSLYDHKITGVVGQRKNVLSFMKGLLIELTALHNYDELKIIVIHDENEKEWEACKWLPHVWSNDHSVKFMADNVENVKNLSNYMEYVVSTRKGKSEDELSFESPYYLIVCADRKLAEKAATIKELYKNKKQIHVGMIALYDEEKYLPKTCSSILCVNEDTVDIKNLKDPSQNVTGIHDVIHYNEDPEPLFVQLSNIKLDILSTGNVLPETISYFDMFKIGQPVHYDFYEKWMKNDPTKSLAVPIGVDENGYEILLDIHENAHGPHGLIAGMTGSGKSEFIISYIAAMAMHFNPKEVAFILIDFKGGGMADVFKNLPHLAGSITNLDGNELNRALFAIESELHKRELLFKKTSEELKISNIDIYKYQSLYREGRVKEALPHLIIVSDEFAELKQQHSEFMDQLIRIARIGRSLGIHLILATQKPDGIVDDQIRSNIKFKVCLKVQDKADSQSMIDCPDAASITNAGRFYFKVGMNELFELGQSAWSGAPYRPQEYYKKGVDNSIAVVNGIFPCKVPGVLDENHFSKKLGKVPEKQIDALVQEIADVAKRNDIPVKKLWLDKIPGPIMKTEDAVPTEKEDFIINPIVGMFDNLKNQSHDILSVPFSYDGNAVVYGASGSGQLEFVNKVMHSMMERYSKEEVQIYAVDFDSGFLAAFQDAPHVRGVYCSYELEKIDRMLAELEEELQMRKKLFAKYGGNYQTYIRSKGVESVPNIVTIVHNYPSFREALENGEDRLSRIAREGIKFGMFLLITTSDSNSMTFRQIPLYKQVFVLQQNNADEYRSILEKNPGIVPSPYLGRGIFRRGNNVYEFQTDMIFEDSENLYAAIETYCQNMEPDQQKERKDKNEETVRPEDFQKENSGISVSKFPVGKGIFTDKLETFDFTKYTVNTVLADDEKEASEWHGFLETLKQVPCDDMRIYDLKGKQQEGMTVLTTVEEMEEDLANLRNLLLERSAEGGRCKRNGQPIPDFERVVLVMRNMEEFNRLFSYEALKTLRFIGSQISPAYHLTVIFYGTEKMTGEVNYKDCLTQYEQLDRGIWLGTDLYKQGSFELKEKADKLPASKYRRGFVIEDGKSCLCRLVEEM